MAQESRLLPYIVETSQLKALGYPFSSRSGALEQAKAFSRDVNSGKISKDTFVNTYFGYGLPQFTYGTWKKELYENTVEKGKDISSIDNQLDYLVGSWKQYVPALHKRLKSATDPQAAAIDVLHSYGMPNWESVKSYLYDNERMNYAQSAYNEFSGSGRMPTNLSYVTSGGARATQNNYGAHSYQSGSGTGIDYTTFLTTIVEVLMSIAGNTAILTKILEILSNNFNINIDKGDIEQAATQSREKAKAALNQLVTRSANNNTNISSLLGNKDTDYLLKVMSAISAE